MRTEQRAEEHHGATALLASALKENLAFAKTVLYSVFSALTRVVPEALASVASKLSKAVGSSSSGSVDSLRLSERLRSMGVLMTALVRTSWSLDLPSISFLRLSLPLLR